MAYRNRFKVKAQYLSDLLQKLKVDDPVSAIPVHLAGGTWGTVAVGLFSSHSTAFGHSPRDQGLLHGGGLRLVGVQLLGVVVVMCWSMLGTVLTCLCLKWTVGFRMSVDDEEQGADWLEHGIGRMELDFESDRGRADKVEPVEIDQATSDSGQLEEVKKVYTRISST